MPVRRFDIHPHHCGSRVQGFGSLFVLILERLSDSPMDTMSSERCIILYGSHFRSFIDNVLRLGDRLQPMDQGTSHCNWDHGTCTNTAIRWEREMGGGKPKVHD